MADLFEDRLRTSLTNLTKGFARIDRGLIEGQINWRYRDKPPNPYQVEHDVLFDSIRDDKPHNEAQYAARSTMTAIMGRMATYCGKEVTWEQAFNSTLDLSPGAYIVECSSLPGPTGCDPWAWILTTLHSRLNHGLYVPCRPISIISN